MGVILKEVLATQQDSPARRYSMAVPFSREWCVKDWFTAFHALTFPFNPYKDLCLNIVVDGDDRLMDAICMELVRIPYTVKYRVFRTTEPGHLAECSGMDKRRLRISQIWKQLWNLCEGEVILGSEDDSLPEPNAYSKLLEVLDYDPRVCFVQGSIVGRWAAPCSGHWEKKSDGRAWWTKQPRGPAVTPIDGGGWYCFVADKSAARDVTWRIDNSGKVGPDVLMVQDMVKSGRLAYGRWDVWVKHLTQKGVLEFETTPWFASAQYWVPDKGNTWEQDVVPVPRPIRSEEQRREYRDMDKKVKVVVLRPFLDDAKYGMCGKNKILDMEEHDAKKEVKRGRVAILPEDKLVDLADSPVSAKDFEDLVVPEPQYPPPPDVFAAHNFQAPKREEVIASEQFSPLTIDGDEEDDFDEENYESPLKPEKEKVAPKKKPGPKGKGKKG